MNINKLVKAPARGVVRKIDEYRKIRIEQNLYNLKNLASHEYLAANPMPELTQSQKKEIDAFWATYGIKISDYSWFRWYYGVTGNHDPRFVPQDVYSYIIWPYHDNEEFCTAWKDKNLFERFVPNVPFPRNYIKRINGRYYDENGTFLPDETAVISAFTKSEKEVVVKDAWDSGEGRGVKKYIVRNDDDVRKILSDWGHSKNYLIQELIHQHPVFSEFNASSVNIMRINTWRNGDDVHVFCPTLRIGTEGQTTDICFVDGVEIARTCAITMDGKFGDKIINQYGVIQPIGSVIKVPDVKIPKWDDVVDYAVQGHKMLDHFDIVGWDFTVTDQEKVVCIEYNIKRPGSVFYQNVNGPFFGEYTEQVFEFLKDKDNQEKFIPKWMRL